MSLTPVLSKVPVDQTRLVYEMSCTYLCGNKVLNLDSKTPANSETCDIGGWAFSTLNNQGWTGLPATYENTAVSVGSWITA